MAPAINNVLSTGGGTPGIKQATLISGVGVSVPGSGASGGTSTNQSALTSMTVNVNGNGSSGTNSPGQPGQNQTIVLSKGPGSGQTGMTLAMASTGSIGSNQNSQGGGAATPQTPGNLAIGIGNSGVQILNMNSLNAVRAATVNVGAVNVAGGNPQVATMGTGGARNVGPRMIISPQMIANARAGQPGVEEYQSEFSEFVMKSGKSNPKECRIDDDGCNIERINERDDLNKKPFEILSKGSLVEHGVLSTCPPNPSSPNTNTNPKSIHPEIPDFISNSSNIPNTNVISLEPVTSIGLSEQNQIGTSESDISVILVLPCHIDNKIIQSEPLVNDKLNCPIYDSKCAKSSGFDSKNVFFDDIGAPCVQQASEKSDSNEPNNNLTSPAKNSSNKLTTECTSPSPDNTLDSEAFHSPEIEMIGYNYMGKRIEILDEVKGGDEPIRDKITKKQLSDCDEIREDSFADLIFPINISPSHEEKKKSTTLLVKDQSLLEHKSRRTESIFGRRNQFPVITKTSSFSQDENVKSSFLPSHNNRDSSPQNKSDGSYSSFYEESMRSSSSSSTQVAARVQPIQQHEDYHVQHNAPFNNFETDNHQSLGNNWSRYTNKTETPSPYKANNPNIFTTDPQLHSQFVQFTQTNSVGISSGSGVSSQGHTPPQLSPQNTMLGIKSGTSDETQIIYHSRQYLGQEQGNNNLGGYSQSARSMNLPVYLNSEIHMSKGKGPVHPIKSPNFNLSPTKVSGLSTSNEFPPNPSSQGFNSSSCSYPQNPPAPIISQQPSYRSIYNPSRSQPSHDYSSPTNSYAQQQIQHAQQVYPTRPRLPVPTCHTQQPPNRWMTIAPSTTTGTLDASQFQRSSYNFGPRGRGVHSTELVQRQSCIRQNVQGNNPSIYLPSTSIIRNSHPRHETLGFQQNLQRKPSQETEIMSKNINMNVSPRPSPLVNTPYQQQCQYGYRPVPENTQNLGNPLIQLSNATKVPNSILDLENSRVVTGSGKWPSNMAQSQHINHPELHPNSSIVQSSSQQYYQYEPSKSNPSYNSNITGSNPSNPNCSLPVICRVSPIRFRYDQGSINEGYNSQSSEIAYNTNSNRNGANIRASINPNSPNYPPVNPVRHPYGQSISQEYPNHAHRPGPYEREDFSGYNPNPYGSPNRQQYHGIRPQFTLQALPGLQPGAQGHHLLVKTENGQYQLLRVAPTATPAVPPNVATTSSMSIAQQLPSNPSLSSTSTSSLNNSNHVVSTSLANSPLISSVISSSVVSSSINSQVLGTILSSTSGNMTNSMTTLPTHQQSLTSTNPVGVTTPGTPSSSNNPKLGVGASNMSSSSTISSIPNNPTSQATYRLQSVPSIPSNAVNSSTSGVGMTASMSMQPQQMYPPQLPQAHNPSFVSNTANTVNQMTAETAKLKCKNFLSFLLELSAKQNQQVARNVKSLIQGLVDGKVNENDFSDRLQKEVNSQPQPCLVGFLKKSLPHLRHSLATSELKIEGIRPPLLSSVMSTTSMSSAPVTALIPQNQQMRPPLTNSSPTPVRIITPIHTASQGMASATLQSPSLASRATALTTTHQKPPSGKSNSSKSKSSFSANSNITSPSSSMSLKSSASTLKSSAKEKDKKSFSASGYSGDDDINDVAAMGGVNLAEESQKILGSTEFVGTQIRSIRDEPFLHAIPLQAKMKAIAAKYGLEEPPAEVAAMISHATEERLKTLLEKLAVIAEHRLDVIKMDERYEVTQDVKGQLRFLEELEKLERKRHDEQEREMLIRAAKSRSKSEDPEQAKLKAKAKEMQRVAMEEMRQREANQTALQAIGPRKKPKLDLPPGSQSTISQNPLGGVGASGSLNRPQMGMRPRLKRVNIRDLLFLLEQEKDTTRSQFLYKHLLSK